MKFGAHIRRLKFFLKSLKMIVPVLWDKTGAYQIVHWHIDGVNDFSEYTIMWQQLHRAHVVYNKLLKREQVHAHPKDCQICKEINEGSL